MWRWLAIAAIIYAGGYPGLEPYRPAAFERSLREFHRDVNRLVSDAMQSAAGVHHVRAMRRFASLSAQFQAMLSGH